MNNFNVLILAVVAGAATFLGVALGKWRNYGERSVAYGSAFAATIMILISAVELIPEAVNSGGWAKSGLFVVLGIALIALANNLIPHLHTVNEIKSCKERDLMRASYLIAIGLVLHDFPEGFAIPSSFAASNALGITLVISSFLHNIPEGYTMTVTSCKMEGKFSYKTAFLSGSASVLGAVLGLYLVNAYSGFNVIFLSLAAGAMLYISLHELLPFALRHKEKTALLWGSASALIVFILLNYI